MFVKQLSVFVENRPGAACDVLEILSDAGINITALSIADTNDFGVIRMIVDATEPAYSLLKENGISVKRTEVLAVPIGNTPGGLFRILTFLKEADIAVEYMYAFLSPKQKDAVVVMQTDHSEKALQTLLANGIQPFADGNLF